MTQACSEKKIHRNSFSITFLVISVWLNSLLPNHTSLMWWCCQTCMAVLLTMLEQHWLAELVLCLGKALGATLPSLNLLVSPYCYMTRGQCRGEGRGDIPHPPPPNSPIIRTIISSILETWYIPTPFPPGLPHRRLWLFFVMLWLPLPGFALEEAKGKLFPGDTLLPMLANTFIVLYCTF